MKLTYDQFIESIEGYNDTFVCGIIDSKDYLDYCKYTSYNNTTKYFTTIKNIGLCISYKLRECKLRIIKLSQYAVYEKINQYVYCTNKFDDSEIVDFNVLFNNIDIATLAVRQSEHALYYVPYNMKTKELCKIAVEYNGFALEYVPDDMKTKELCKIAVVFDGYALEYVPDDMKTEELCKNAVVFDGYTLKYVPDYMKTYNLCNIAVQNNGVALQYVPDCMKTYDLCKIAVAQDAYALVCVPDIMKTEELYKIAIKNNILILQTISNKTEEICKFAVMHDGKALHYIPYNMRTEEICKLAEIRIVRKYNIDEYNKYNICTLCFDKIKHSENIYEITRCNHIYHCDCGDIMNVAKCPICNVN